MSINGQRDRERGEVVEEEEWQDGDEGGEGLSGAGLVPGTIVSSVSCWRRIVSLLDATHLLIHTPLTGSDTPALPNVSLSSLVSRLHLRLHLPLPRPLCSVFRCEPQQVQ